MMGGRIRWEERVGKQEGAEGNKRGGKRGAAFGVSDEGRGSIEELEEREKSSMEEGGRERETERKNEGAAGREIDTHCC